MRRQGRLALLALKVVLVALLTSSQPDSRQEAELYLHRGNDAFRAGLLEDAIREYTTAYRLFPSVGVLYNLGRAYEDAGRKEDALETFRRFLRGMAEATPDKQAELATRVPSAEARVKRLEQELKIAAPSDRPPASPIATSPRKAPIVLLPAQAPAQDPRPASHAGRWWALGLGTVVVGAIPVLDCFCLAG